MKNKTTRQELVDFVLENREKVKKMINKWSLDGSLHVDRIACLMTELMARCGEYEVARDLLQYIDDPELFLKAKTTIFLESRDEIDLPTIDSDDLPDYQHIIKKLEMKSMDCFLFIYIAGAFYINNDPETAEKILKNITPMFELEMAKIAAKFGNFEQAKEIGVNIPKEFWGDIYYNYAVYLLESNAEEKELDEFIKKITDPGLKARIYFLWATSRETSWPDIVMVRKCFQSIQRIKDENKKIAAINSLFFPIYTLFAEDLQS